MDDMDKYKKYPISDYFIFPFFRCPKRTRSIRGYYKLIKKLNSDIYLIQKK